MRKIDLNIGKGYPIYIGKDLLKNANKYFNLNRKVLVVTDDNIPSSYSDTVCNNSKEAIKAVIPNGEESKSMSTLEMLLYKMQENKFTRGDCVVALGGGVVGDLSGFCASVYMRGVDFYNIPTTLLSMVDSSVGGKTAVNFAGLKNTIGTFYQPKGVLCDISTLKTLPERQLNCGFAEIIKMSMTNDSDLFTLIENKSKKELLDDIENVIFRSVIIKKSVVEEDEKELGLRRVLNFGHTVGHAIEQTSNYYHGECVALGMLPMCGKAVKDRLIPVLKKISLPFEYKNVSGDLSDLIIHDKKSAGDKIHIILCPEIGCFEDKLVDIKEIEALIKECIEK